MIQGGLVNAEKHSDAIKDQDVIVSLLGPAGSITSTPYTDAYRLIFSLMKRWIVKRIYAMGTPSIPDPEDGFSILAFLGVCLIKIIANSAYQDIVGVGKIVETQATKDDGLDWTISGLGFFETAKRRRPKQDM